MVNVFLPESRAKLSKTDGLEEKSNQTLVYKMNIENKGGLWVLDFLIELTVEIA